MVTHPTHSKETYKFNFKEQLLHIEQRLVMHLWIVLQKQPPQVFCVKGVLRKFAKFTRKHLCQSHVFNKVAGLKPQSFFNRFHFFPNQVFRIVSHKKNVNMILKQITHKISNIKETIAVFMSNSNECSNSNI